MSQPKDVAEILPCLIHVAANESTEKQHLCSICKSLAKINLAYIWLHKSERDTGLSNNFAKGNAGDLCPAYAIGACPSRNTASSVRLNVSI